jgi:two-component system, sensor histidine kinase YesM
MLKLTIRSKIFIYISSLIILSLIVISLAVYFLFYQTLINNETKYAVQASDKTKQNIEFVLNLINNTGSSLGSNSDLLKELDSKTNMSKNNYLITQNKMNTMLQNIISLQQYIKGIYILSPKGDYFTSNLAVKESELKETYKAYLNNGGVVKEHFTGIHQVTYHPFLNTSVISYIRPIFNVSTGEILAFVIIDIDYDLLKEMFTISSIQYDEKVLVVAPNGENIFNYPYNVILDDIIQKNPSLMEEKKLQLNAQVFGNNSIIVSNTIDFTDWKIIRVISSQKIHEDIGYIENGAIFIFIIFICISVLASFVISSALTKPIKELNSKFKAMEKGDLSVSINIRSRDEIGELGNSFNTMVRKLKSLINSIIEEQKRKSDMEFQILQAQINPHFLYNTLDSIKWLAAIQNVNNIAEMSTALINLLKYNISNDSAIVSLSQEIESINNYIVIQKYRYGDIFDVVFDIDPQTNDCQVLRFIIQPIVENSIIHGFENTESKGIIQITSKIVEDNLVIQVIDNGTGISSENLNKLPQSENYKKKFSGIGIHNVQERIKVYFGDKYGMTFESQLSHGTKVSVVLPINKLPSYVVSQNQIKS